MQSVIDRFTYYMLADFTDATRRGQTQLLTFPMKLPAQSSEAVERRTGRSKGVTTLVVLGGTVVTHISVL